MVLKIDRMEIDDAGGDPIRLAHAILRQLPDLTKPIPVREIATAIEIYEIREEILEGLEGGLIVSPDKSEGAILVHSDRPETRKRYTISHEIGHYVNPWHQSDSPDGFRCKSRDMNLEKYDSNDRVAKMEVQANQFAAELLMPKKEVDRFLKGKAGTDISHILTMADKRFNVSREAAARRYIAHVSEPSAVIFSKNGIVRYCKFNSDFPKLSLRGGEIIPSDSISSTSKANIGEITEWKEVPDHIWLDKSKGISLFEQTISQKNGFRMTLLSIEREEDAEEWEAPSFRR